ncbi:MAG: flavin reductase family protein [Exilibacterium sp.]
MIDQDLGEAMKEGMRRLASGVCVLSTRNHLGDRFAMTASSVTSVSDSPASLLVCVNKETSMYRVLEEGGGFCINVLAHHHEPISSCCASGEQGESRFLKGHWRNGGEADLPYLQGALATFFCVQDQSFLYGTHKIIIGRISEVLVGAGPVEPLIYLNGSYHRLYTQSV